MLEAQRWLEEVVEVRKSTVQVRMDNGTGNDSVIAT